MGSIERTLDILLTLGAAPGGLSLVNLSNKVDVPPPSTRRILKILESKNMTRQDTNKIYHLGPAFIGLTRGLAIIGEQLNHVITDLSEELNETVFISAWNGEKVICTMKASGDRALQLYVRVGQTLPVHATASARLIAAYLNNKNLDKILGQEPLRKFTPTTPVERKEIMRILKESRENSIDISYDELDRSVLAISVPIWTTANPVPNSLTVAGSVAESELEEKTTLWTQHLRDATNRLNLVSPFESTTRESE